MAQPPATTQRRYKILIVDDEPINRKVVAKMIEDPQYDLFFAVEGESALEIVQRERPHLILLDLMMPGLDGFDTLERLKSKVETAIIPVIIVTARSDDKDLERTFAMGAADYIRKPLQSVELIARVRAQLKLHDFENERLRSEQLEYLSQTLSSYITPNLLEHLTRGKMGSDVQPRRHNLTIFFSDIIGFTEMTDSTEPETLTKLLNTYFNDMSEIVNRYGGTLDKFMGDAILVFFGHPDTEGVRQDALRCVMMALDMRRYMDTFEMRMRELDIPTHFRMRMGINTGYCTVGNFGSKDHLHYTIIGGPVNTAARLQSKTNPNQILISENTWSLVKDQILCSKRDLLSVKGIAYPVQTYEVVDEIDHAGDNIEHLRQRELDGFSLKYDLRQLPDVEIMRLLQEEIRRLSARIQDGETSLEAIKTNPSTQ